MRSSPMMQRSLGRTNHLHQILPNSLMWIPAHQTNHQSHQWLWRMARIWEWGSTASLLQKMCKQEEDSANWKQRYLVKLPRKGDFSQCGNWQGIMLLFISNNILTGDILKRLDQEAEIKASRVSSGSTVSIPHHYCIDHHWAVHQMAVTCRYWDGL